MKEKLLKSLKFFLDSQCEPDLYRRTKAAAKCFN